MASKNTRCGAVKQIIWGVDPKTEIRPNDEYSFSVYSCIVSRGMPSRPGRTRPNDDNVGGDVPPGCVIASPNERVTAKELNNRDVWQPPTRRVVRIESSLILPPVVVLRNLGRTFCGYTVGRERSQSLHNAGRVLLCKKRTPGVFFDIDSEFFFRGKREG